MADRTSAAALFGKIFSLLAKNPTDEHKAIAKEIFSYTDDTILAITRWMPTTN